MDKWRWWGVFSSIFEGGEGGEGRTRMTDGVRSGDRNLSFVEMPRQPTNKRKRSPEEIPTPQTLEVISFVRRGDKVVKKRVIEKMDVDPTTSPILFPDDDVLPAPSSQVDPSAPSDDADEGPFSDAASQSVSVSPI
jgi:hypothetical protein